MFECACMYVSVCGETAAKDIWATQYWSENEKEHNSWKLKRDMAEGYLSSGYEKIEDKQCDIFRGLTSIVAIVLPM